jgi:enolase
MPSTKTASIYSAAEALFRLLSCDEIAEALQAADLSPEVLTAIDVASVAVREDSKKRRFMAADGSDTDEDLSEDEEGLCWGNKRFVIRKIEDGHLFSHSGAAETFERASEKLQQVSDHR